MAMRPGLESMDTAGITDPIKNKLPLALQNFRPDKYPDWDDNRPGNLNDQNPLQEDISAVKQPVERGISGNIR